jgi:ribosomal protein S18 acetylase RimI-like enzyme
MPCVAGLLREYAGGIGIDLAYQGFESELASLPGAYASPRGVILLAEQDGLAIGCVALRPLVDDGICEMKRLHIRDIARGKGLGRALAEAIIGSARGMGYAAMRLDTLSTMHSARGLYRSLGFREIAPYYHTPVAGTIFMQRDLQE